MANINTAKRCQVGITRKKGIFQVYHCVLGKNRPPLFVPADKVAETVEMLQLRAKQKNN